jgi:simple sugar transport system ATP-binding protein
MTSVIEMRSITKRYRGVAALTNVNFDLRQGEIHGLVGENGAGKSTLTKIMAGVTDATAGTMVIEGQPVTFRTPAEALRHGITMVFQETSLVPSMTVAKNLYLGDEKFFNRLRGIYISAQTLLQSLNFKVDPWATVSTLGAAMKQMVEIARAVRQNAKVIIFDEPTASLTPEEKNYFFLLMKSLRKRGVSIIFISHVLEEALHNTDRISVLRDGELIITDDAVNLDRDKIIRAMVGRSLSNELYSRKGSEGDIRAPGEKVLSVQNLSMNRLVRNSSFTVYAGQVTGIFGLVGSGRTETAKIIAGVLKRDFFHGGEIRLFGRSVRYRVPSQAVHDGIVYVTEDRKSEGFFETMSMAENLYMGALAAGTNRGVVVRMAEVRELAKHWARTLNVRAISADPRLIELSGGNQQKVVIGKSLVQRPRLIIFDEPTRGVDVGAIAEIHQLIRRLADEGTAVVVISSYLPEVMNLSDRLLVCRAGRVVEEFSPANATEERIMYAAVH